MDDMSRLGKRVAKNVLRIEQRVKDLQQTVDTTRKGKKMELLKVEQRVKDLEETVATLLRITTTQSNILESMQVRNDMKDLDDDYVTENNWESNKRVGQKISDALNWFDKHDSK